MSPTGFDPPSHEEDVRRGLGQQPADSGKVQITNYTPAEDAAAAKLAAALSAEFASVFGVAKILGDRESWMIAAHGLLTKMSAQVTSGEDGIVIVTLP